jgi:Mg-chelatase subunit ChlD
MERIAPGILYRTVVVRDKTAEVEVETEERRLLVIVDTEDRASDLGLPMEIAEEIESRRIGPIQL